MRTQVEAVARGLAREKSETRPMEWAREALLLPPPTGGAKMPWQQPWEPVPLFADIAEKAENVQLRCAATMDRTSATTRAQREEARVRAADAARKSYDSCYVSVTLSYRPL